MPANPVESRIIDARQLRSEKKRIILLCDGTGNSICRKNERATNVKRFLDTISPTFEGQKSMCKEPTHDRGTTGNECSKCEFVPFVGQQIVYYQSGVGTSTDMGDLSLNYSQGTGSGINDNILDAYCWLASNYNYGDEIFIFGFSRGAFTARVVANIVIQLGLFYKNRMYMLPKAWAMYTKDEDNWKYFRDQLWEKHYHFTRPVSIRVLGVWDTVGAVGLPDYMPAWARTQNFHQSGVLTGIDFVFHALATDEYRRTFGPTLFYLPEADKVRKYKNRVTGELEEFKEARIVLKQCWFAGAHSNVGGSYPSEHIADIALGWMIDQCSIHEQLLAFDPIALYLKVARHRDPARNVSSLYKDNPGVYRGWGAGAVYDSFKNTSGTLGFLTYQYRAPGIYTPDGKHPGPAGMRTPKPASDITWKDYEDCLSGRVWRIGSDAPGAVGRQLRNLWGLAKWFALSKEQKAAAEADLKAFIQTQTGWDDDVNEALKRPVADEDKMLKDGFVHPSGRSYCGRKECCHPARRGRYRRIKLSFSKDTWKKAFEEKQRVLKEEAKSLRSREVRLGEKLENTVKSLEKELEGIKETDPESVLRKKDDTRGQLEDEEQDDEQDTIEGLKKRVEEVRKKVDDIPNSLAAIKRSLLATEKIIEEIQNSIDEDDNEQSQETPGSQQSTDDKKSKFWEEAVYCPYLHSDRSFATCEAIHATIFTRYKKQVDTVVDSKRREQQLRLEEDLYTNCAFKPISMCDWHPAALFPFEWESNEVGRPTVWDEKLKRNVPAPYSRYRREEIFPGGPAIWTGKCPASKGLYFEMLEEPDSLYTPEAEFILRCIVDGNYTTSEQLTTEDTRQLLQGLRRVQVDDMMLRLNRRGTGGRPNKVLPGPKVPTIFRGVNWPEPANTLRRASFGTNPLAPTNPLTPPRSRAPSDASEPDQELANPSPSSPGVSEDPPLPKLTAKQLKQRYLDALYLDDDFDVKHKATLEKKRLAHWREIKNRKDKTEYNRVKESLNWAHSSDGKYLRAQDLRKVSVSCLGQT